MGSMHEHQWDLENGGGGGGGGDRDRIIMESTQPNLSNAFLKKSSSHHAARAQYRVGLFRQFLGNLRVVILGTKLCVLIPAFPLAILAQFCGFGRVSLSVFIR